MISTLKFLLSGNNTACRPLPSSSSSSQHHKRASTISTSTATATKDPNQNRRKSAMMMIVPDKRFRTSGCTVSTANESLVNDTAAATTAETPRGSLLEGSQIDPADATATFGSCSDLQNGRRRISSASSIGSANASCSLERFNNTSIGRTSFSSSTVGLSSSDHERRTRRSSSTRSRSISVGSSSMFGSTAAAHLHDDNSKLLRKKRDNDRTQALMNNVHEQIEISEIFQGRRMSTSISSSVSSSNSRSCGRRRRRSKKSSATSVATTTALTSTSSLP